MANHGTVVRELVEYRDRSRRIVISELADGWHVTEHFAPGRKTRRVVTETLAEARELLRRELFAWSCASCGASIEEASLDWPYACPACGHEHRKAEFVSA